MTQFFYTPASPACDMLGIAEWKPPSATRQPASLCLSTASREFVATWLVVIADGDG